MNGEEGRYRMEKVIDEGNKLPNEAIHSFPFASLTLFYHLLPPVVTFLGIAHTILTGRAWESNVMLVKMACWPLVCSLLWLHSYYWFISGKELMDFLKRPKGGIMRASPFPVSLRCIW